MEREKARKYRAYQRNFDRWALNRIYECRQAFRSGSATQKDVHRHLEEELLGREVVLEGFLKFLIKIEIKEEYVPAASSIDE